MKLPTNHSTLICNKFIVKMYISDSAVKKHILKSCLGPHVGHEDSQCGLSQIGEVDVRTDLA